MNAAAASELVTYALVGLLALGVLVGYVLWRWARR
jgi:hypothetical protein